ncbi:MAG: T9SS type A sorting domain-containing protein, partial [Flavobacteriales bacterium]
AAENAFWSAPADYWECICSAEQALIREVIAAEEFEVIRLGCLLLGPQERRMQPAMTGDAVSTNNSPANYSLFPNPAMNTLYLRSDKLVGSVSLRVVDVTGRLIKNVNWPDRGDVMEMDVSALKSGVYFVSLTSENQTEVIRFTKF